MSGVWREILDSAKLGVAGGIAQLDGSGLLKDTQVPSIPSTKITGLIPANSIPNIDASKIISGVLGTSRIPSLDASKITSGSFLSSRIPTLEQSKINGLSTALNSKVNTSRKINGKALTADISIDKGDVGLTNAENKSSATIRSEISLTNIIDTGIDTSSIIKQVTQLPASGNDGQMVKLNGSIYVWKDTV